MKIIERLHASQSAGGGWGYSASTSPNAEPTALATLALAAHGAFPEDRRRGLQWLDGIQRPDGGVPITKEMTEPCWPTALALLAWLRAGSGEQAWDEPIAQATSWLLATAGKPMAVDRAMFGHDPTLIGWGWAHDTHSWAEPTSHAILAMKAAGKADHSRVREGVRLLLDRAIPTGGWNYGNTRVMDNMLRPFPAQTGVVLAALAGEGPSTATRAAAVYLEKALESIRSPMSLGWGAIGLKAWQAQPGAIESWLDESMRQSLARAANPLLDSLLLLAAADRQIMTERESNNG